MCQFEIFGKTDGHTKGIFSLIETRAKDFTSCASVFEWHKIFGEGCQNVENYERPG